MYPRGQAYAFDLAPPNPKSRYLVVGGGHTDTPATAAGQVAAWVRELAP
jgi:hypothetical protein